MAKAEESEAFAAVSVIVTQLLTELPGLKSGLPMLLRADPLLGEVAYRINQVSLLDSTDPDFLEEALEKLQALRSVMYTAVLHRNLIRNEYSAWVQDLDNFASGCYAFSCKVADELREVTKRQAKAQRKKEAAKRIASASGGLADKLAAVEVEEDEDEIVEELVNDSKRFNVRLLAADVTAGIATYPCILSNARFNDDFRNRLAAYSMKVSRIFEWYNQIPNCRYLGVERSVLPGNPELAREVAEKVLAKLQNNPKTSVLCRNFSLAQAMPRVRGEHVYYVILPTGTRSNIQDGFQWDFGNPEVGTTAPIKTKPRVPRARSVQPGDVVKFRAGSKYTGMRAVVRSIEGSSVTVEVIMFGKPVSTQTSVEHLEKVNENAAA